jgi:hypothetical protein
MPHNVNFLAFYESTSMGVRGDDRLRLLKIAARVTATAIRLRIAFAATCLEAARFSNIACCLRPPGS